jgi:hypothetical protein
MTDSPSISGWKKLAIRAFFAGAGFAITLAVSAGAALWYHNRPERPKPWNNTALKATFDTMDISASHWTDTYSYPVGFYYNVQNNTDTNYQFSGTTFTPMAVLSDGNVLSKEFGSRQDGNVTVDGPAFIPPGGTARITIRVSYYYPDGFTKADQADVKKVIASFNNRLKELNGLVLFNEENHYRINLPEGWKQMEGVKEDKPAAPTGTH